MAFALFSWFTLLIYFLWAKSFLATHLKLSLYREASILISLTLLHGKAPPQRKKSGNRIMKSYWLSAAMGSNTTQAILKWGLTMKIACIIFIAYGVSLEVLRVGYQKRVSLWVSFSDEGWCQQSEVLSIEGRVTRVTDILQLWWHDRWEWVCLFSSLLQGKWPPISLVFSHICLVPI